MYSSLWEVIVTYGNVLNQRKKIQNTAVRMSCECGSLSSEEGASWWAHQLVVLSDKTSYLDNLPSIDLLNSYFIITIKIPFPHHLKGEIAINHPSTFPLDTLFHKTFFKLHLTTYISPCLMLFDLFMSCFPITDDKLLKDRNLLNFSFYTRLSTGRCLEIHQDVPAISFTSTVSPKLTLFFPPRIGKNNWC